MKNLKENQKITFIKDGKQFTRKIISIYIQSWNKDYVKYNTRGVNGGYGCNGFSVEANEIIRVY